MIYLCNMSNEVNNEIYYALWYYTTDGEKSTNAISKDPIILSKLHNEATMNYNSNYHNYKHLITKIDIEQIQCFVYYEKSIQKLSSENWNMLELIDNGAFYSSYNTMVNQIDDNFILEEILIYLSKEDHETWRKLNKSNNDNSNKDKTYPSFFYTESISNECVYLDFYYEEGIMNA